MTTSTKAKISWALLALVPLGIAYTTGSWGWSIAALVVWTILGWNLKSRSPDT